MKILLLEKVDSTNSYAKQLRDSGFEDNFAVIYAKEQFAGRGQGDHIWESEAGKNLTFSCIFKPSNLDATHVCKISQAVSLGVADFVRKVLIDHIEDIVRLKWPNDIFVGKLKIAGILIENVFKGGLVDSCVIGVGININQTRFSAWIPNPVSLKILSNEDYDINEMLTLICESIYNRLNNLDNITEEYQHSLYLLNELVEVNIDGKVFKRRILGVDEIGELIVVNE